MHRIVIFFLFVSVLSSCYSNDKATEVNPTETEVIPDKSSERIATNPSQTTKAAEQTPEGKSVTYESCASYAAATDYAFLDKTGKRILVRVNHFENDKFPNPVLPDNMKESGENIEGPSGANPKLVGKEFKLIYDDKKENVLEIVLAGE